MIYVDQLLSKRYLPDGKPSFKLSTNQLSSINEVKEKLKLNIYKLTEVGCPICMGNEFSVIAKKDRFGFDANFCVCKKCGLVMTNPRLAKESLSDFYVKYYRDIYNKNPKDIESYFLKEEKRGRRIFSFVNNFLKGVIKNANVLEVGSGAGGILTEFKKAGANVVGVDFGNDIFINYGRKKGIDLLKGDLSLPELNKKNYDLIIFSHVLEHLENPMDDLNLASQLLKENGIIYIEVPGIKEIGCKSDFDFLNYLQNAHLWHFTKQSILNLLNKGNFEVLKIDEFIHVVIKPAKEKTKDEMETDYLSVLRKLKSLEARYSLGIPKVLRLVRRVIKKLKTFL
ncbi:class I SAM-dependent methyltransferase [Candidatus Dojkabacteria bacterium]|jgi:2-polyprenyl-3-methyl-5-hydroxy-6-metoxy-1,4-benzoquinol methylase|nr:class I SAM-dependent methyltransferase [Candidatus Dojkabacteria bacterium]